MFTLSKDEQASSKCYVAHSTISPLKDNQLPTMKKRPFTTMASHPFSHTVDLILPEELYQNLQQAFSVIVLRYSRVTMSLSEIITGDFFNHYIKTGHHHHCYDDIKRDPHNDTGNIVMLSEGRPAVDNVFSLRDGVLRLEIDKPTYERCGLAGKPIPDGGRKHTKARYAVELNLRLPSMLHGKKGFERIVWAFKNVLTHSVTWLFCNIQDRNAVGGPISKHHPVVKTISPTVTRMPKVLVPSFKSVQTLVSPQDATELLEWISLLSLRSVRVNANDNIDSYLSRYEVPSFAASGSDEPLASMDLVRLRWHGFIDPKFMTAMGILPIGTSENQWFAMNVCCFDGAAYTVLKVGKEDCLTWECV
ncbi:hypothetical protein H2199_001845 [Coniosporium tulheliwenetii]|uniref:Uncharacterized protein n=1 Tax=Coniosporium tulheliwenetii TaxID=3383036 RepID=A0ACC2ZKP3_9PEZI|nr:hypothetical protein H2199_001845 [Cladosporium sp. JES 115]